VTSPTSGPRAGRFAMHPDGTASHGSRDARRHRAWRPRRSSWCVALVISSPADSGAGSENSMGELVRIMYVHVPVGNACYLAFFVTAVASGCTWKRKTEGWDLLAAVVGRGRRGVHAVLTLATGSVWGHIAWGTWWEWDPRLTSTLLMLIVYVGYLALRSAVLDPVVRAKRAAVVGLVAFANVPIVHYSVDWWRGIHQPATISRLDPTIDGLKLFALMFGMLVAVAVYGWLMIHRFRLEYVRAPPGGEGARLGPGRTPGRGRAPGPSPPPRERCDDRLDPGRHRR
jgi:heme exporter protein C